MLKVISHILVLFLFVFGPVLNSFGNWFDLIFFFSILYVIWKINYFKYLEFKHLYIFIPLIVLFGFVSIRILYYPSITLNTWLINLLKPLRVILTFFTGIFLAIDLRKRNINIGSCLSYIYIVIFFHSLIMSIQFFNIDFRNFIYDYTTTGEFRSSFEYDFRMGGLSGTSGGAVLSVVQAIGIIILPFILKYKYSVLLRFLFFLSSLLIIFSIFICGRSGLYALILFLPISFFLLNKFYRATKIIFIISIIAFLLFTLIYAFVSNSDVGDFYYAFNRTFDSFISYKETGVYENETVLIIKDYILFPDIVTFLIGDNDALLNTQFERNLDSDIGYVRNLFSFGIIGFILYLLPFIYLLYYSIFNIRKGFEYKLFFLILFIMLFFHFKENFIYVRMFWSICSILYGLSLTHSKSFDQS